MFKMNWNFLDDVRARHDALQAMPIEALAEHLAALRRTRDAREEEGSWPSPRSSNAPNASVDLTNRRALIATILGEERHVDFQERRPKLLSVARANLGVLRALSRAWVEGRLPLDEVDADPLIAEELAFVHKHSDVVELTIDGWAVLVELCPDWRTT